VDGLSPSGTALPSMTICCDCGGEVGLVDKLGRTPLHRSARLGYGAATKLLVDRGSVVTTKDNDARTARDLTEGSDRAIKALNGEELDFYVYKDRMLAELAGPYSCLCSSRFDYRGLNPRPT
jgi:hypothetical protein